MLKYSFDSVNRSVLMPDAQPQFYAHDVKFRAGDTKKNMPLQFEYLTWSTPKSISHNLFAGWSIHTIHTMDRKYMCMKLAISGRCTRANEEHLLVCYYANGMPLKYFNRNLIDVLSSASPIYAICMQNEGKYNNEHTERMQCNMFIIQEMRFVFGKACTVLFCVVL